MDRQNVTITRFDGSSSWGMAIMPADRRWMLYTSTAGGAYLYERAQDITDEHGDTRERYVLTGRPEGLLPAAAHEDLVITITQDPAACEPGSNVPYPWIARCNVAGACGRPGKTKQEAVVDLFDEIEHAMAARGVDVAVLAL